MKNIKTASVKEVIAEIMLSKAARESVNHQYYYATKSGDDSIMIKVEEARQLIKEGKLECNKNLLDGIDEEWVKGYEGVYSVTRDGDVFSYHEGKEKLAFGILKSRVKFRKTVLLCRFGKSRSHYVSKIVADAFLAYTEDGYCVRFKDGDTLNCNAGNLYYETKEKFYAETSGLQVGVRKEVTSDELDYVLKGVGEKPQGQRYKTVIERLTEQDLIDAGIPPEYLNFSTKDESIWKAFQSDKRLAETIDAGYSIADCAKILGVSGSQISSFKSGRRGAKQKAAYYKFKEYLKTVAESV